eukprot:5570784-Amphidinium_carterae.1
MEQKHEAIWIGRDTTIGQHITLSTEFGRLSLYNIKENTNSLSTTGAKRPPIATGEQLNAEEHSTYRTI